MDLLVGAAAVLVVAAIALAVGIRVGMLVARPLDRMAWAPDETDGSPEPEESQEPEESNGPAEPLPAVGPRAADEVGGRDG